MTLHNRIPVEPLDEERLTNIERRLVVGVSELAAHPARGSRRYLAFAGAAFAVAAAAVLGWKLRGNAAPIVQPQVAEHFAVDTALPASGFAISTIELDGATISYGDTGATTAFEVARSDGRVVVDMKHGTLDLAVQHVPGRVLVIRAGDTEIEDIGTKFSVAYDGKASVDVRVTEGEVKVSRHQQDVRVAAGKAWTSDGGLVALADLVKPAPAPVVQAPTPAPPIVAITAPQPAMRDHQAAVPAVATPAHPVHVQKPDEHHEPIVRAPTTQQAIQNADPYVELRTAIRKQPIAFDPKIDGKADAANEIAKLKKIAYSPTTLGPEAAQATYQIAVLLHRPLGQDAEALHTLDMYRRRFASGKEMSAALWLRVRIQCGHTIDEDCRRAAYSYQHEVTTGEAAEVAIRITNAQ
jgi:hypothetical protein